MDDLVRQHEVARAAYLDARDALVDALVLRISEAVHLQLPDASQVDLVAHLLDDGRASLEAVAIYSAGASMAEVAEPQERRTP